MPSWDVDDRGGLVYAVAGHVTPEEFADAVATYECEADDAPRRLPLWTRQEWERCVPSAEFDSGVMAVEARPGSRGAYRITVGEIPKKVK